ncbi:class I SAM-dependent methyltransferase [Paraglaciecola aquimarina]|uniref:Ribosomal RNA small subunit methyltransferase C n=1 Tax=Paraglaciecola algarum TaxID=3050085 RepID=A0ABS9DB66_9ALTE|nr:class I SAM-dependent methyltransferase [Paraglaciecola sp. G1-23]MCF2949253.1 class I SAM-dependent methyltransferase [Paraglaciecola sp. G1-23]
MLSAPSQVLVRNKDIFTTGKWLLVNPTDTHITSSLGQADISVFHQYFDIYQQSQSHGNTQQHTFAAAYPTDNKFDGAVIYVPKSKDQLKMLIANIAACLNKNGSLLLVGENKGGIKSAVKLLDPVSSQTNKIDSARHCALFGGQVDKDVKAFDIAKWHKELTVAVAGLSYKVCSLPGVFNHGSLDLGTQLLLENLPDIKFGRVLDFGCGAGVIGCFVGLKSPDSKIVMSDVSALAVYCSQQSAKLNGLDVEVLASNGLANVTGKFSTIVTNPPFHTGIQTDYSVTEGFIGQLNKFIAPSGNLVLVANKFLRYSELLEKRFNVVTLLKQTTKFSLYQCNRVK